MNAKVLHAAVELKGRMDKARVSALMYTSRGTTDAGVKFESQLHKDNYVNVAVRNAAEKWAAEKIEDNKAYEQMIKDKG